MKITLAKALKLKNKSVEDYHLAINEVLSNNSRDVDETKDVDAKEKYEEVKASLSNLVEFKTKIHEASAPIRGLIFELSEVKNLLVRLRTLNTKSGVVKEPQYGSGLIVRTFEASISESEKKAEMTRLENEIVRFQDVIDEFNSVTTIEI